MPHPFRSPSFELHRAEAPSRCAQPEGVSPQGQRGRAVGRLSVPTLTGGWRHRFRVIGAWCVILAFLPLVPRTGPIYAPCLPLEGSATRNWAGYSVVGSDFTGVTGTFNVPAPLRSESCLEETSVWVGVDGVDNGDLLQAGIAETGFSPPNNPARTEWPDPATPPIFCGGPARIFAWWEDLPSSPVRVKLPVAVGDSVTVSIFQMSPGWWAVAVHDVTAKRSFLLAQPYAGPQASVEWVVEAPQVFGVLRNPVPFSTVNFRHLGAEGQARDLDGFSFRSGAHVASPSEVIGSSGHLIRGFTVHWARSRC